MEDQLVVFDDFLVNRIAHWHCTLCGRSPMVRAGTWICTDLVCAFVVCHACDAAGHAALLQIDRKLRARYGLRPPPEGWS